MKKLQISITSLTCLLALLCMSTGCGSGDVAGDMFAKANDVNIKRVSSLYSVYAAQHGYKGPKDEAEFKAFISQQDVKRLKMIGVDPENLDALFISERDNKAFRIRWELSVKPRQAPIPIVFEEDGEGGKKLVAFSSYVCREVDHQEYDKLWRGEMDDIEADTNRGGQPGT